MTRATQLRLLRVGIVHHTDEVEHQHSWHCLWRYHSETVNLPAFDELRHISVYHRINEKYKLTCIPMERLMLQHFCVRFRFLRFLLLRDPSIFVLVIFLRLTNPYYRARKMSPRNHEHCPLPSILNSLLHLIQFRELG